MESNIGRQMLSESKFYMGYSRWNEEHDRFETWDEAVERVMDMHREKYKDVMSPELDLLMKEAEQAYKDKLILGAQRALQFGGEQLFKHEARMYNCSVSHADRPQFFNEAMYLLLCGCGVGFSVQRHHVAKLPHIKERDKRKSVKVFQVPDSIEGWADAFAVLLSSYFVEESVFPQYQGHAVYFDFSLIRPKGSMISGGFKAPGPDGLRNALFKCEELLHKAVQRGQTKLEPIEVYDFVMHMSDAVLSGGVRRSATICLFDKDDEDMLTAKTGNWFIDNPQRGRSNNSAIIVRDELTRGEWSGIIQMVKNFGEPGFIFTDNKEFCYNPCVEIGMLPKTIDGRSGWQFCNLTESNGSKITNIELFLKAAKASAIMATLQAGYTNFKYLSKETKEITEREALIGVSITGWMNNPDVLFNEQNMTDAANEVKRINKIVANLIGINPAARTTCAKPSGNASVILGTESGIHGAHSNRYIRNVQMNEMDEVLSVVQKFNPEMVEKSVWSANGTDFVVSFPVEVKEGTITRKELLGVKQLEYVKKAQQFWVEAGTDLELCVDKNLRHNISNTISVDNWEEVEQYLFDNRKWFAGVSLLSASGDKDYPQAPFTEVLSEQEIIDQYGVASMFASGLIVDGLQCFGNLWKACDCLAGIGEVLTVDNSDDLLKRDWVRRANKFAKNYFNGDTKKMTYCLKDVYNLHKWTKIVNSITPIDFSKELSKVTYTEVDSLAGAACAGGACEVVF